MQTEHVKLGNKLSSAERKLDALAAKAANAPAGPNISIITKDLMSEIAELQVGIVSGPLNKEPSAAAPDGELLRWAHFLLCCSGRISSFRDR